MSRRKTLRNSEGSTCSPESACGTTPSDSRAGQLTDPSGPAAAPANRFRAPASGGASGTSGTCGRNSTASSASAALSQSLASRLRARTESNGSTEYRLTWKDSVTPSGRRICRLRASGRRTSGNDCSGWPTCLAIDADKQATGKRDCLSDVAKLSPSPTGWGTPSARDGKDAGPAFEADPSIVPVGSRLPRQVMLAGWPSETASLADKGVRSEEGAAREFERRGAGADLPTVATLAVDGWQTPTLEDSGRNGSLEGWQKFTDEQQWSQCRLRNQIHTLAGWGSPRSSETGRCRSPEALARAKERGGSVAAEDQVHLLAGYPTPAAQEFEPRDIDNMMARRAEQRAMGRNGNGFGLTLGPTTESSPAPTARRVASRLNPAFSLWLMGIPPMRWLTSSPNWSRAATVRRLLAKFYERQARTERES